MEQTVSGRSIAETFLSSLSSVEHVHEPYDYFLLERMLPQATLRQLQELPFEAPEVATFSGRRETNNATRVYFTREAQAEFPVVRDMADAFGNAETVRAIEKTTDTELSAGRLRIEYCIDTDGFWLEPHTDISVKLFTMLVYLSEGPALRDAGTDVYDATPEHNLVVSAPYAANAGLIFIPGKDTWHGFSKRPINGVRTSLIINFVTPEWRDTWELC